MRTLARSLSRMSSRTMPTWALNCTKSDMEIPEEPPTRFRQIIFIRSSGTVTLNSPLAYASASFWLSAPSLSTSYFLKHASFSATSRRETWRLMTTALAPRALESVASEVLASSWICVRSLAKALLISAACSATAPGVPAPTAGAKLRISGPFCSTKAVHLRVIASASEPCSSTFFVAARISSSVRGSTTGSLAAASARASASVPPAAFFAATASSSAAALEPAVDPEAAASDGVSGTTASRSAFCRSSAAAMRLWSSPMRPFARSSTSRFFFSIASRASDWILRLSEIISTHFSAASRAFSASSLIFFMTSVVFSDSPARRSSSSFLRPGKLSGVATLTFWITPVICFATFSALCFLICSSYFRLVSSSFRFLCSSFRFLRSASSFRLRSSCCCIIRWCAA
mmetsp:Transcript_16342/g.49158  ORF Transcript_16342/g.49158 Transcript_16342/m.49158 type:complete len:402 (+) Transcript_16342:593-1798(+)